MIVQVQLFAVARQLAGASTVRLELSAEATLTDVRAQLATQYPNLASILSHAKFAVDNEYADDQTQVGSNSEVACIPPVSGG